MKPILVPIDFSENSITALQYAVALARVSGAPLTLFNSYHVALTASLTTPPSEYIDALIEERAKSHTKRLNQLATQYANLPYERKEGKIAVNTLTLQGVATEQIEELTESGAFSMVVMGTKGASGLGKILWGSIASHVSQHAKIPVLVVPHKAKAPSFKRIVYATNFDKQDIHAIDYVRKLTEPFDPVFTCLHISDSNRHDAEDMEKLSALEAHYWFTPVSRMNFELIKEKSIEKALKDYFKEHAVDLLVALPQHKNFVERILSGSLTQKFTLHATIPILLFKD